MEKLRLGDVDGAIESARTVMRPHRSRFQLGTTVCVQIGEAIDYQIRRHQAGSRRLIRSAASAAREAVNALGSYAPARGKPRQN
jgi:hypothetical protein